MYGIVFVGLVPLVVRRCVAPTALGNWEYEDPALTRWANFWHAAGAGDDVQSVARLQLQAASGGGGQGFTREISGL